MIPDAKAFVQEDTLSYFTFSDFSPFRQQTSSKAEMVSMHIPCRRNGNFKISKDQARQSKHDIKK